MELTKLLQEGDAAGLEMQKAQEALDIAKSAVEAAKERLDLTKNYFEQAITRAEESGIPRAKFKKVIEERVAALWNSGLLGSVEEKTSRAVKTVRAAKKPKEDAIAKADKFSVPDLNEISEENFEEDVATA